MNIFHDKQDEREPDFSSFDIELFGDMADNSGFYDGCVATWRKYALPLHDKIASLESQLKEKDKEIERLKEDHYKSLVFISDQGLKLGELREALMELVNHNNPYYPKDFIAKCRKLIGD